MNNYYVQILSFDNDRLIKEFGPTNERRADKIDDGLNINLDHNKYYTIITQKQTNPY